MTSLFLHMLGAGATTFLFMLIYGHPFIRQLTKWKIKQPIRDEKDLLLSDLHKKKRDTPTMGGLLIILTVFLSSTLWMSWSSYVAPLLLLSFTIFGSLGIVDDWLKLRYRNSKGLKGKIRFLIQTIWALCVIVFLSQYTSSDRTILFPFLHPLHVAGLGWIFVWFIQWLTIAGSANAVNLTDGLDGLSAGCSLLASIPLILFAYISNQHIHGDVAIFLSALTGASLGFLWFNSFPADVFMGDTGSLAIGGALGTSAVILHQEWLLALCGGIFVIETFSVMIQVLYFKKTRKRIFKCAPIHHHFEYEGLPEPKVVIRFWIIGALLSLLGTLSVLK